MNFVTALLLVSLFGGSELHDVGKLVPDVPYWVPGQEWIVETPAFVTRATSEGHGRLVPIRAGVLLAKFVVRGEVIRDGIPVFHVEITYSVKPGGEISASAFELAVRGAKGHKDLLVFRKSDLSLMRRIRTTSESRGRGHPSSCQEVPCSLIAGTGTAIPIHVPKFEQVAGGYRLVDEYHSAGLGHRGHVYQIVYREGPNARAQISTYKVSRTGVIEQSWRAGLPWAYSTRRPLKRASHSANAGGSYDLVVDVNGSKGATNNERD